ncbi:Arm DNA-binding domain-containing protein [Burkholderia ambifaria]|uniref:Arm DNA-binding domain-containing protein n=1 Tax=Burkholderia ambifaria TaxID=152480 RepID=UPI00312C9E13
MPLTDVEIRQAKAGNKPTKLTDGNGLYLLVNPSGSKLRRYSTELLGKKISSRSADLPPVLVRTAVRVRG